ncbi:MAG: hypothetical protein F6K19_15065 [Cyanothece sp. SIO1E1]|nr:hypothetical protein [Cyanothece sp. SIO1E1]
MFRPMNLLCLSNGHGEDAIALRILQALQQHPAHPQLAALPLVGEGHAYYKAGIPIVGPTQSLPSGGFIYMDSRQTWRDLRGGLLQLTLAQLQAIRAWTHTGGVVLAVGDIVPLLFAWWSGVPYAFVGTAKSEYYLRDEAGPHQRTSWFETMETWAGSVYLPWERWLMGHRRCQAVFPRDSLTAETLKQWSLPVFDLGNPMMDGLGSTIASSSIKTIIQAPASENSLKIVLLPGSRVPEAYANWQRIMQAVGGITRTLTDRRLLFLGAIAPGLDLHPLEQTLETQGWQASLPTAPANIFETHNASLILTQDSYADCLQQADLAIAMAGTATEQFVGLGKPAIIIPGGGPQFTFAFAEAQTRHLGPSITLVDQPEAVADAIQALLQAPDRLQIISQNGRRRMGEPGAADRIAACLMAQLAGNKSFHL